MQNILIVEDEDVIRSTLERLLTRNHYQVASASNVDQALALDLQRFDLIISDIRMPGKAGTELINNSFNIPVLIMTSYASMRSAIDVMKMGAVDYIAKPFDHQQMLDAIKNISHDYQAQSVESAIEHHAVANEFIGQSAIMQRFYEKARKVALADVTVLIHGESGTGKELVARSLVEQSHRKKQPFVSVNCAAIPESLIESELFGHEKGAFTGASASNDGLIISANKGTLFLDEIGELPLEAQARLLRVIQEQEVRKVGSTQSIKVDIRILSATHREI